MGITMGLMGLALELEPNGTGPDACPVCEVLRGRYIL